MARVECLDQVLSKRGMATMTDVWHRFPGYRTVQGKPRAGENRSWAPAARPARPRLAFAPGVPARADAGRYQRRRRPPGDPFANKRSLYFREVYAEEGEPFLAGIQDLLCHPALIDAARAVFGAEVVVPWYVYANVFLPGQELSVHTDVPEFRGLTRHQAPLWLLVVMHHSGLFEPWSVPIATAVLYVAGCAGGDLTYFADGSDGGTRVHPEPNTAVLFDADTIFHGVDRVSGDDAPLAELSADACLLRDGRRSWVLRSRRGADAASLGSYASEELRYSVSWKALCFADGRDHERWLQHADDLDPGEVISRLAGELVERGKLAEGTEVTARELAELFIEEFVPFPA